MKKVIVLIMATIVGNLLVLTLYAGALSPAESLQSLTALIPGYQMTWQEAADSSGGYTVYASDNSFGTFCARDSIYRHYDSNGNMLWSTSKLDFFPESIDISSSGNRVMILHYDKYEEEKRVETIWDIYDRGGSRLFQISEDYHELIIKSSPHGKYYYSLAGSDAYVPLRIFDEGGQLLFKKYPSSWSAGWLNDSLLAFIDYQKIQLIKIPQNEIVLERALDEIASGKGCGGYNIECSKDARYIAIWSMNDVYVMDSQLNLLKTYNGFEFIIAVKLDGLSGIVAILANSIKERQYSIYSGNIHNNSLNRIKINLLQGEGFYGGDELIIYGDLIVYNFISGTHTNTHSLDPNIKEIIPHIRSYIVLYDSTFDKVNTYNLLETHLYPLANTANIVEQSINSISIFSGAGGK